MRKSFLIPTIVFGLLLLVVPHFTHAAINTNNFGPILTSNDANGHNTGNNICGCKGQNSAPDYGCLIGVAENALSIFASFAIMIITIYIAWAGVTFMLNPTSPEARSKARGRLLNAIIGLFIVLCAWLLVDTVMKVIYNQNASFNSGSGTVQLGMWNTILAAPDARLCLKPQVTTSTLPTAVSSANPLGGAPSAPSQNANAKCTATAFQPVFGAQAAKMSCVTHYENGSCNATAPSKTDVGTDHQSVSWGIFQINISANNLSQYPACEAVVNNQPLNCTQAFAGGAYTSTNHSTHVSNQSLYNTCVQAVQDPTCNEEAAQTLLNNKKGIGNWGTAAQSACSSL